MRQPGFFKKSTLIFGFFLVFAGLFANSCVKNKNQLADTNTGLKAESVPEGILLTFGNIPADTARLFIQAQTWLDAEGTPSVLNLISSFTDLRNESLEQIKQTGTVILPVVQAGQKYDIAALLQTDHDLELMEQGFLPDFFTTECVAENGIYFEKNIELKLIDNNTGVTLSSEPVFSSEVTYAPKKYRFAVTIRHYENETGTGSISVGDHHIPAANGLTWVFDPAMTESFRENKELESGSYPAYATVFCNIIYDNITWAIEIAKTPEFIYSL